MRHRPVKNLDAKIAAHSHLLLTPEESSPLLSFPRATCVIPEAPSPLLSFPRASEASGEERSDERNAGNPQVTPSGNPPAPTAPGRWYERETLRYAIPQSFAESPVYVEFGCGKGDFVNTLAQSEEAVSTGALLIGVEGGMSVILAALRKTAEAGLSNVRYINHYVNDAAKAFAPASLDGIFLNFSDPWPKDRHADRRLTAPAKAAAYLSVLKPGGFAVLKTDGKALYEYSLETFRAAGFAILYQTDDLPSPPLPPPAEAVGMPKPDPGERNAATSDGKPKLDPVEHNTATSDGISKLDPVERNAAPADIPAAALAAVRTQTEYERRFRGLGYPISCFIATRA